MTEAAIRVEAGSVSEATFLLQELEGFHTELVEHDGRFFVHVVRDRESNELVVSALAAVERWLARQSLASATVHLDERSYTLNAPVA